MNELRQTVMAILYGLLIPWRKFWRKFLLKRSATDAHTHTHRQCGKCATLRFLLL